MKTIDRKTIGLGVAILVAGIVLGAVLFGGGGGGGVPRGGEAESLGRAVVAEKWTCSMHPQIQETKSGKCGICGMDLIPVGSGGGKMAGRRELVMSEEA